jgi:hypothetical protein
MSACTPTRESHCGRPSSSPPASRVTNRAPVADTMGQLSSKLPGDDGLTPPEPAPEPDATPMVTAEEHRALSVLLLTELQYNTPYDQVWAAVHRRVCAESRRADDVSVEQLTEAYEEAGHRVPPWRDLYTPTVPEDWATPEDISEALASGGEAQLDLYWRALDRFPGGNADFQSVCYTFDCRTRSVSCRIAHNWDGQPGNSEYEPRRLTELLKADAPRWSALLAAVAELPRDSECTILDTITRCAPNLSRHASVPLIELLMLPAFFVRINDC